jgi:hypothetical protein
VVEPHDDVKAWGAIHAGVRPSTVLAVGAGLTMLGPLLNLGPEISLLAWGIWGVSLVICSVGMITCGLRPWFSHLGVAAGMIYLAQFSALAAVVAGLESAALAYRLFAIPKLLIFVVIALTTRKYLRPARRRLLAVAGVIGTAKIILRTVDLIPAGLLDAVDAAVNTLVAVALLVLANGLRHRENEWAHQVLEFSSSSFEDFNPR